MWKYVYVFALFLLAFIYKTRRNVYQTIHGKTTVVSVAATTGIHYYMTITILLDMHTVSMRKPPIKQANVPSFTKMLASEPATSA